MNDDPNIGRRISYGNQSCIRTVGTITKAIPHKPGDQTYTLLGAAGATMVPLGDEYRVIYDDGRQTTVHAKAPDQPGGWQWEDRAERARPDMIASLEARAAVFLMDQAARLERASNERDTMATDHEAEIARRRPSWAKAVIFAAHHVDKSDLMSDYHGHTTDRLLLLAWSTHTRDLFPEMRKACRNAPEVAHLVKPFDPDSVADDFPEDARRNEEHREKYSMGGGYYLGVYRDSTGWVVKKDSYGVPEGEWRIPG